MSHMKITHVDCTLRDGGYYNNWDFPNEVIAEYLCAMDALSVDYVEIGFRSLDLNGFKGACAYSTDDFIKSFSIPNNLKIGVMVNASELIKYNAGPISAIEKMFVKAELSPVSLVRIACHMSEVKSVLPACLLLKKMGYKVGLNLMQIGLCNEIDLKKIAQLAIDGSLDVLYVADSFGSLDQAQTEAIFTALRLYWKGALGFHAHDNMGRAILNTLNAIKFGVKYIDSTVTGMGRGPGNTQTEFLVIELEKIRGVRVNLAPTLNLIDNHFSAMKSKHGWGTNPYYYLAGQYAIHPTYIQEMLNDPRYGEVEILSVIEHLRVVGGEKFNPKMLDAGREMYGSKSQGTWKPADEIEGRDVLIVGAGPSVSKHKAAIERYILKYSPYVIALNTQGDISSDLINVRAVCHPFRIFSDFRSYKNFIQPFVMPIKRLPSWLMSEIGSVTKLDFGLSVLPGEFQFNKTSAVTPKSLVIAYAIAIATSGNAKRIFLAGLDGYEAGDSRAVEIDDLIATYQNHAKSIHLLSITPTLLNLEATSVYAL